MKITVILTSYNHEKFIRQSIESVLKQTYQDFEFIIVDDCSSDSSWDIICEYQKRHPQIITIRHEYNWHGGTVEDVVKNYATGEYIALHHSDDVWDENKLQKQIEAMERTQGCVAVFTNAEAIDDDGNKYADEDGFYYNLFQTKNRSRQEWLNYFFYHGNCLCHPSILIRKDVYEEDGFFRKGLRQIPDFVKWIQVCRKHEIFVLPDALVKFRVHASGKNESGMRAETQIRSTVELYLMLEEYAQITSREDFLKVFPEAESYCKEEAFIPEYALGRICTQKCIQPYTRIYGVSLLYLVLNNPEKAEMLKEHYNYTMQAFMEENGKYDIFGILPEVFEQVRSLYIDSGNGFNSEEMYCEKFTLGDKESFEWTCEVEVPEGKQLQALRFDPAEGVMSKVRLQKVTVNSAEAEVVAENALCQHEGADYFVNLDPIYSIKITEQLPQAEKITVTVAGEVFRLTGDEINQTVAETMYTSRDALYECQARLLEAETERNQKIEENQSLTEEVQSLTEELQKQTEELQKQTEELQQIKNEHRKILEELGAIKNTRIYRLAKKIYHGKREE